MECSMIDYLNKYVQDCSRVISQFDSEKAYDLIRDIVDLHRNEITDLDLSLNYSNKPKDELTKEDYIKDLSFIREKFRFLLAQERRNLEINSYMRKQRYTSPSVVVNANSSIADSGNSTNTQNQTVHNTFDIKIELNKVRAELEADEVLDDDDKKEINEKLNEIEEVINGASTNNEKWKQLKSTFTWVATKSYKVGQWSVPIITKALFPEVQ